jgi:uncharacterized membrane protein
VRRLRRRVRHSLVAIPLVYLAAAIVLGDAAPALDRRYDPPFRLDVDTDTARDILTATATGMIAFTGLVVSSVLVMVQFAAAQYSPRLVLWFRRDPIVKHAIGSFLATFLYSLVALRELQPERDDTTPDVTVALALLLLGAATILFLVLLERVMDRLRPRTLYGAVAREGITAAHAIYPHALADSVGDDRRWSVAQPRVVAHRGRPGVIVSFDHEALLDVALAGDATIELVPGVGEFVAPGQALLRIHGSVGAGDELLRRALDVADERTIRQDPAFALRIIVDTAIRALSPAVNDPTTAVHALDVLEPFVRDLAGRDLEASVARGPDGTARLAWRSPSWPDLLELAFSEIRFYGASSVQIARRLRAVLEDLRAATPPVRHPALDAQLALLDASVGAVHPAGSPEYAAARVADRLGLGLTRPVADRAIVNRAD